MVIVKEVLIKGFWVGIFVFFRKFMNRGVIDIIYGLCNKFDRKEVFDEIFCEWECINVFWIIIGNFNEVRSIEDRGSMWGNEVGMDEYNKLIDCV